MSVPEHATDTRFATYPEERVERPGAEQCFHCLPRCHDGFGRFQRGRACMRGLSLWLAVLILGESPRLIACGAGVYSFS